MAEFLEVREVGLRDGIQSIKTVVPTDLKIAWIKAERDHQIDVGGVFRQQLDATAFRGRLDSPERESSVKQMIGRVAGTIATWGREGGYFA